MLQILRNKAQSTIIQAIVVIIALVFIFWGVGTNLMNNREAAIIVNGEEISFQTFQRAYDQAQENLAKQFGGSLPKGLAESMGIKQQVIRQLVQTALLRQGAAKMGVIVSEEELQDTITNMVQFQNNNGFSIDKYQSLIAANRTTPTKFEANMRHDMLADKTVRCISRFASLANEEEVKDLYRQDNEKVAVTYSRISPDKFSDKVVIDEEKLASWYSTVKENYRGEPQVKLKYLDFSYGTVGTRISIEEDRITTYYKNHQADFTVPEKRRARHILIKTGKNDSEAVLKEKAARAEEIRKLAEASDDFAAIARQYSEGPSKDNGGELGFFTRDQMIKPFTDAVFAMEPGNISKVVKTDYGYHIIKLEEVRKATTTPLAEARDQILETLRKKEAKALAFQLANSAYEGIIASGSLQAYGDLHPDQPIVATDFFPRSNPPAGQPMDKEFLDTAFSLNSGDLSSLLSTNDGYFILYVEEIKQPETPELSEVREQAVADYRQQQATTLARERADKMLEELRDKKDFATTTAEGNLPMLDSGFLGRNSSNSSDFPASLINQVFTLSSIAPLPSEPAEADGDFYVFQFRERQVPEVGDDTDLERYRQALLQSKQQQLLSAFLANLQADAEVTVHKSI